MIVFIILLVLVGFIVYSIYPAISLPHQSEFTTQDGLEDVVTDDKTIHVKTHNEECVKKEIINATTTTTDDFVEKEQQSKGVRQLSEHIKAVVVKEPEKVKKLNKRQRKVVDKIVNL